MIGITNKEKVLNELSNNVEKLARFLIKCNDVTRWDEIPMYEYVTSDETVYRERCYDDKYAYEEALKHEIEWLNSIS